MAKKSQMTLADLKLEDVLKGSNKNIEAIAEANRAIFDGYTELAKRQYEMLKEFIEELKEIGADEGDLTSKLKQVMETAKDDVLVLQKLANKTNAQAQKIIKKRTDANLNVFRDLMSDAKAKVFKRGKKEEAKPVKKKATKKKAAKKKASKKQYSKPVKKS